MSHSRFWARFSQTYAQHIFQNRKRDCHVRFLTVNCCETKIEVNLDFETEIVSRPENMVCVRRGELIYSIPIKEKREKVEYTKDGVERKYPYCDYYIYPESKWNYALANDKFELSEQEFDAPFNPENPPVVLTAELVEIE